MKRSVGTLVSILLVEILLAGGVIAFNVICIPRVLHLMNHVNRLEYKAAGLSSVAGNGWLEYMMFYPLSEFIFRNTGNYCDAPDFNGTSAPDGKNMTISYLISNYGLNNATDTKKIIYKELEYALGRCDPDVIGEGQPLAPLHMAVLRGDAPMIVSLLIHHNARTDSRITRKGKEIDGMTPLELARLLADRVKGAGRKQAYQDIIRLLENAGNDKTSDKPHRNTANA
ncbi:MAG: hypothetical protein LBP52_05945 [Burkholderiaceae bacterium]|jgi:hypothetical protein|nr:hypothetical protein [Burkholderiaceae bacterium]